MVLTSRRRFLKRSATLACTAVLPWDGSPSFQAKFSPIVDAHIHLFDPTRPGGVPWPLPTDTVLYRPALPSRYSALARPEGVLAAIAVECSPLVADNDWLLQAAASNDLIVAVIGDLDPSSRSFPAELDRLSNNPLFRGIRSGNLWDRDLGRQLTDPLALENFRNLADRGLVLESANPTPSLVADLLRLASKIPSLRIVIDHLPQAIPPDDLIARKLYLATLKHLREYPQVFVKCSEIPRRVEGAVPLALSAYKVWLDTLWEIFGEDRLFFGSDWPNSDHLTSLPMVFTLAQEYFWTHSAAAARKFFWSNSIAIYHWKPRNRTQRNACGETSVS